MRATKKSLTALSALLVLCVALFLALRFAGREAPEPEGESRYYFTNYAAPEALAAVSVENEEGSVVLARTGEGYRALCDAPVPGDGEKIANFFARVCRLPLRRLVEGASASDGQYGLTEPRATVVIQDAAQGGAMFLLGGEVPGGEGVYTCLAGDERVFVMESDYARPFLSGAEQFLDLTLYPSLEGEAVGDLKAVEVRRDGETAYRLRQISAGEGGTAYYALEAPWKLLLGAEPVKSALLTPLRELEGIRVLEGDPADYGLTEASDCVRLTYGDGSTVTVLAAPREGEHTAVTAAGSGVALLVPTSALSFLDAAAEDVMGRVLLRLNIHDVESLTVNGRVYEISGGAGDLEVTRDGEPCDAAQFQNTVFSALNRMSVGGPLEGDAAAGETLLDLRVRTRVEGEEISLVFRRMDGRRCAVEINGQTAVWCDLAAAGALLDAAD